MRTITNVVQLLENLISIPSVNPEGNPGTAWVGEKKIALFIAAFLKSIGASVTLQQVFPSRPNIIASFKPSGNILHHIAFAPHLDTVSVEGMTIPPFTPTIKGGKLYGRGSSDTKGPMAAMLWALREWSGTFNWRRGNLQVTFAGLMGEEAGNDGAHFLARQGFKADLVVVGEPTQMKIVHAHKSALWLTFVTRGKACHGSTPEKGRNAILEMNRVLSFLQKKIIPALKKKRHPKLGWVTLNPGVIRGGSKTNIVPDSCSLECDIRTIPGFDAEDVLAFIRKEFKQEELHVTLHIHRNPPPLYTDPKLPLIQALKKVSKGLAIAPWFCDAAIFAARGVPAIAFGPGSIAQAHICDEFIRIRDLKEGTQAYLDFLKNLSS